MHYPVEHGYCERGRALNHIFCSEHARFVTLVNEEVPEDVEEGYSDEGRDN